MCAKQAAPRFGEMLVFQTRAGGATHGAPRCRCPPARAGVRGPPLPAPPCSHGEAALALHIHEVRVWRGYQALELVLPLLQLRRRVQQVDVARQHLRQSNNTIVGSPGARRPGAKRTGCPKGARVPHRGAGGRAWGAPGDSGHRRASHAASRSRRPPECSPSPSSAAMRHAAAAVGPGRCTLLPGPFTAPTAVVPPPAPCPASPPHHCCWLRDRAYGPDQPKAKRPWQARAGALGHPRGRSSSAAFMAKSLAPAFRWSLRACRSYLGMTALHARLGEDWRPLRAPPLARPCQLASRAAACSTSSTV